MHRGAVARYALRGRLGERIDTSLGALYAPKKRCPIRCGEASE
jgi:hypothetical protein